MESTRSNDDVMKEYRKGLAADPNICASIVNCTSGDYRCTKGSFGCFKAKNSEGTN
jgi:hypothetical protein